MNIISHGMIYNLFELGGGQQRLFVEATQGVRFIDLLDVVIDRTVYLNLVLVCNESMDAVCFLQEARKTYCEVFGEQKSSFEIIDEGHVYLLTCLNRHKHEIRFVKRSGGAITYQEEWSGIQTQELLRVLTDYLDYKIRIGRTIGSLRKPHQHEAEFNSIMLDIRNTLFLYEVRAYRRKQEKVNKMKGVHDDTARPKPWNETVFDDIPFIVEGIEKLPIGEDGHIILLK